MARLDLRLDKQSLGADLRFGVVARVCQIKDANGKLPDDPQEREVVIPAGAQTTRTVDGLPLGTYRIEARLPSGLVLRKTRQVTDDQQAEPVVFVAGRSPHEWLSLQRLAGNVPPVTEYEGWINTRTEQARMALSESLPVATRPAELELLQVEPGRAELLWDGVLRDRLMECGKLQPDVAWRRANGRPASDAGRSPRQIAGGDDGPSGNPVPVRSCGHAEGQSVILPVPRPMLPEIPSASLKSGGGHLQRPDHADRGRVVGSLMSNNG
jgi:hypothetical protein